MVTFHISARRHPDPSFFTVCQMPKYSPARLR